jgi:hypothetical protein
VIIAILLLGERLMKSTPNGIVTQTPEEHMAMMMAEQAKINDAERRRVERDNKKKMVDPLGAAVPNIINNKIKPQDDYPQFPAGGEFTDFKLRPNPAMMPVIDEEELDLSARFISGPAIDDKIFNTSIAGSKRIGTVILEGYYTIADLRKYIELMEKYA